MTQLELAIIGGSGLYNMPDLQISREVNIRTPYGEPSDTIKIGQLAGRPVAFLPRHGRGHVYSPSTVPYRANIYALKTLGVKYVIGVSACGSLREDYAPGHIVVPDQLVDFTKGIRGRSFFTDQLVAHIGVAHPFSPEMGWVVAQAVRQAGGTVHEGGSFITIEGPRFSTLAESNLYRQWGMSIIGMTTSPEAFLVAEAEMAYACMAHITDYDVWHETEGPVTVEMVIRTLQQNTVLAQAAIRHIAATMADWAGDFPAHHTLKDAIITERRKIPESALRDLAPLVGKYFT
ncbi:MAG: S-methyl-5'-thioadenosine phosphorylase [Anaerolineae bacterium]|nr:S-methyl-5'-thioadenosine phosphorylase [Anaerolineae bacterium]